MMTSPGRLFLWDYSAGINVRLDEREETRPVNQARGVSLARIFQAGATDGPGSEKFVNLAAG